MTTADFPHWYAAYVTKVVDCLGDLVPYWITFNEPNLLVYGYVKPWWQPYFLVPPRYRSRDEFGWPTRQLSATDSKHLS